MNRRTLAKGAVAAVALAAVAACAPMDDGGDIVDVATGNPDVSTLVTAVAAADLVETLQGPGPFTVFAPTDAAFAALPAGTVDTLLMPENKDALTDVLTYHVVSGYYPASALLGQRGTVTTVQGGSLAVDGTGDAVTVGGATVVAADVMATNGVIHVIDAVLLP